MTQETWDFAAEYKKAVRLQIAHLRWYAVQDHIECKRCHKIMPNNGAEYCCRGCELGYRVLAIHGLEAVREWWL